MWPFNNSGRKVSDNQQLIALAQHAANVYYDHYLKRMLEDACSIDNEDPVIIYFSNRLKWDHTVVPDALLQVGYDSEDPAFNEDYLQLLIDYVMACRNFIWPLRERVKSFFYGSYGLEEHETEATNLVKRGYQRQFLDTIHDQEIKMSYLMYNEMEQVFFRKCLFLNFSEGKFYDNNMYESLGFGYAKVFLLQALCMYNCMKYEDLNPLEIEAMHFCKHKFPIFETDADNEDDNEYGRLMNGMYGCNICDKNVRTIRFEYEEE